MLHALFARREQDFSGSQRSVVEEALHHPPPPRSRSRSHKRAARLPYINLAVRVNINEFEPRAPFEVALAKAFAAGPADRTRCSSFRLPARGSMG